MDFLLKRGFFLWSTSGWSLCVFRPLTEKNSLTTQSPRYMVPKCMFRLISVFTKISLLSYCFHRVFLKAGTQTFTWSTGTGSVETAIHWSEYSDLKMAVLSHTQKAPWGLFWWHSLHIRAESSITKKKKLWSHFNETKKQIKNMHALLSLWLYRTVSISSIFKIDTVINLIGHAIIAF